MMEALTRLLAHNAESVRIGAPASDQAIAEAEEALGLTFSETFIEFVREVGWLEVDNTYIFGIPTTPLIDEGSAVRMTLYARQQWKLPDNLIVIYSSEDELLWCISGAQKNTTPSDNVVTYSTLRKKVVGQAGESLIAVIEKLVGAQ